MWLQHVPNCRTLMSLCPTPQPQRRVWVHFMCVYILTLYILICKVGNVHVHVACVFQICSGLVIVRTYMYVCLLPDLTYGQYCYMYNMQHTKLHFFPLCLYIFILCTKSYMYIHVQSGAHKHRKVVSLCCAYGLLIQCICTYVHVHIHMYSYSVISFHVCVYKSQTPKWLIRESVDSLCRDDTDTPIVRVHR